MKVWTSIGLAIVVYCSMAMLICHDLFSPALLLTIWSNRLGAPLWTITIACSALLAALVFIAPVNRLIGLSYRLPIFVFFWIIASVALVGFYAEGLRHEKIRQFGADFVIENSFLRSLHEAPRDFQLFLHAAALKNCVPYAWSYREMAFYRLRPATAVNVLPQGLITQCNIK